MKKALLISALVLVAFCFSCKKYVRQQEQNALVQEITSGSWVITRYMENDSNITASFSGYVFHFQTNGIVLGDSGTTSVSGTWSGDITTKTITSNFPSVGDPLDKLNSVWKITDSYPDSVAAATTIGTSNNILNMHKQ